MISFNYLRSARPEWLRRSVEIHVPERLHAPLFGVLSAIAVIGGAWGIENYRLSAAQGIELSYRQKFEISDRALRKTKIYYHQVETLVALDLRVRSIVASGDSDARCLAEIANSLPEHTWLTSISRDESGISLEGGARNLRLVGNVLRGLIHAHDLRNPTLMSARVISERPNANIVKYVLHVDETRS